jgi:hypothetical protein
MGAYTIPQSYLELEGARLAKEVRAQKRGGVLDKGGMCMAIGRYAHQSRGVHDKEGEGACTIGKGVYSGGAHTCVPMNLGAYKGQVERAHAGLEKRIYMTYTFHLKSPSLLFTWLLV